MKYDPCFDGFGQFLLDVLEVYIVPLGVLIWLFS